MGYPAVIKFDITHNHNIDSAEALYHLTPLPETRAKFESYFNDGLGITDLPINTSYYVYYINICINKYIRYHRSH